MVFKATDCASARFRVLAVITTKDDFINSPFLFGMRVAWYVRRICLTLQMQNHRP